jgi:hypothetical protein
MILEFRPHCRKMRIPVPGQKVHISVPVRHRPQGIDGEDSEPKMDEILGSVRQDCVYCDKGEKGVIHCLLSLSLTEILVGLNDFEELNQNRAV